MSSGYIAPKDIEKRSFEIITEELTQMGKTVPSDKAFIIKRCIHTTADFDYADTMFFSDDAVNILTELIKSGATIVTDTNMALSGINKSELSKSGAKAFCFMSDEDVIAEAGKRKITRATVSMEKASKIAGPVIFVIGNAPTALMAIKDMHDKGIMNPAFIVGVPVGFVNVTEAKDEICNMSVPCIVNRGRKGGSNVAAAIINAVLYRIREQRDTV